MLTHTKPRRTKKGYGSGWKAPALYKWSIVGCAACTGV